jgi:putative membrane protein
MSVRLRALILILTAIYLAQNLARGTLYYYIGPRFGWLAILAVILLIVIAGAYHLVERREEGHDPSQEDERTSAWPLVILALPLLLGVIVPARPLGASAAANRGITTGVALPNAGQSVTLSVLPGDRTVLDWARLIADNPDPAALDGQPADVVGFVYRDSRFAVDQLMVGRFTIACCVADALAVGVMVEADNAAQFPADTWVRVTGRFRAGEFDGEGMPVLLADTVEPVQPPEQPYLFP